jgi:hypothetical protein
MTHNLQLFCLATYRIAEATGWLKAGLLMLLFLFPCFSDNELSRLCKIAKVI